jgi:acyl carrier protein
MKMDENEWRTKVTALIAEIRELDASTIKGDSRLREDLGMDSLNSLELLSGLGEQFKLDLPIEDALALVTVDDASAFVMAAWKAQHGEGA